MNRGHLMFIFAGLVLLGGCGEPEFKPRSLLCTDLPPQILFDTSVAVLQDMQFQLETADPAAGMVRTWPLRGSQFFELWRSDNASARMAAMANLHSIQRMVELEIIPSLGKTCLQSRVFVRRLSLPGEFPGGTRLMAALFTEGDFGEPSILLDPDRRGEFAWIDLGRDEALEQELLNRIENQIQEDRQP